MADSTSFMVESAEWCELGEILLSRIKVFTHVKLDQGTTNDNVVVLLLCPDLSDI